MITAFGAAFTPTAPKQETIHYTDWIYTMRQPGGSLFWKGKSPYVFVPCLYPLSPEEAKSSEVQDRVKAELPTLTHFDPRRFLP